MFKIEAFYIHWILFSKASSLANQHHSNIYIYPPQYCCLIVTWGPCNVMSLDKFFFLANQTYSWKLSQSKAEKNCQGLTILSLINFSCTCIHRLQDSNPIAWILALPISNSRSAAVVESSLINSMRCAESGAPASNVRVSETEAIISSNLAH